MIRIEHLDFSYPGGPPLLEDISLSIDDGMHVALMGRNGSGKSTIARLVKGLLEPTSGDVAVDGFGAGDDDSRFEMMCRVGLVFQNPDVSIVSTTVERELAFGLENTGVPPDEMTSRIDEVLDRYDLARYRHSNPTHLSGEYR